VKKNLIIDHYEVTNVEDVRRKDEDQLAIDDEISFKTKC